MEGGDEGPDLNSLRESVKDVPSPSVAVERPTEVIVELQVKCSITLMLLLFAL